MLQRGRLAYIHIDFRLGLDVTDATGKTSVIIETRCRLLSPNADSLLIPAEPASLAPVLALFNLDVDGMTIQRRGQLKIAFRGGHSLAVDPDERCEAWQIGCPSIGSGVLLVCPPGGEVTVFQRPAS